MSAPLQLSYKRRLKHQIPYQLKKLRYFSSKPTILGFPLIGFVVLILSACSGEEIKPLYQTNPATDYCLKLNGSTETIKHINGDISLCTLPNGEVVDSWELFRRDHQKS